MSASERRKVTLWVDRDIAEDIAALAAEREWSRGHAARHLLTLGLEARRARDSGPEPDPQAGPGRAA